ncbi:hypothetical protein ABBQ32_009880 [Trebouxia sp. C0010 RCD-2024]
MTGLVPQLNLQPRHDLQQGGCLLFADCSSPDSTSTTSSSSLKAQSETVPWLSASSKSCTSSSSLSATKLACTPLTSLFSCANRPLSRPFKSSNMSIAAYWKCSYGGHSNFSLIIASTCAAFSLFLNLFLMMRCNEKPRSTTAVFSARTSPTDSNVNMYGIDCSRPD